MNKKPRSDAKLLNLPEPQAAQLRDLLFEGASYIEAVEFVHANFGITTGKTAVSEFWRQQCLPLLPGRRQSSLQTARDLANPGGESTDPFDQAAQSVLQQRLFEWRLNPCLDSAEKRPFPPFSTRPAPWLLPSPARPSPEAASPWMNAASPAARKPPR